jgi:hypothetical protein
VRDCFCATHACKTKICANRNTRSPVFTPHYALARLFSRLNVFNTKFVQDGTPTLPRYWPAPGGRLSDYARDRFTPNNFKTKFLQGGRKTIPCPTCAK